jgi:L-fucose mutarotase
MLIGISPLVGPDLLATLSRMGHGDELVLADAHFPAESVGRRVLRADGLRIADLLDGILPLFAIDAYVPDPIVMMAAVEGDRVDPAVHERYRDIVDRHHPGTQPTRFVSRFEFYDRARQAFAVVATGDTATYANLLLKKGVTPLR